MGILEGKTCIVTGAAGSLGLASVRLFVQEGARVMLVDRDRDALGAALKALPRDAPPRCWPTFPMPRTRLPM